MRINPLRTYERIMMKPIPKPHSEGFRDAVYHNAAVLAGTGLIGYALINALWDGFLSWFTSPSAKLVRVVRVQSEGEDKKHHE